MILQETKHKGSKKGCMKMTKFEALAAKVADTFKSEMEFNGFETFKEMSKANLWDAEDIRQEICGRVDECGGSRWDDLTVITIGWDEMKYGAFKKLVLANLK